MWSECCISPVVWFNNRLWWFFDISLHVAILHCFISGLRAELYHVSINDFRGLGRPNILSQHHHRRQVELIEKKLWKRREKKKKHTASAEPGWGLWREDCIQVIKSQPKINLFHQALHLILSLTLFSELPVYPVQPDETCNEPLTQSRLWLQTQMHRRITPSKSWNGS